MTSQLVEALVSGEPSRHHITSGVEEALRLTGPVEEQISRPLGDTEKMEVNYKVLLAENEQLKEEHAELKSSEQKDVKNVFKRVEHECEMAKDELIRIEEFKSQRIPELEEENENFLKYMEKVKEMYEEQTNHLKEIKEENVTLVEYNTTLREHILALEEEEGALHSKVRQLHTTTAEQAERLHSLIDENCTLEANMSTQLMQKQSSDEEIQSLQTELESVHKTIKKQADQISQLQKDKSVLEEKDSTQELKLRQMVALEEERLTLQTNLEELKMAYEEQREKMSIFRKKSSTLDELVDTQRQEMILSEKEKESLSTELEKIKTTNNELNDRLRALMNDKKELGRIVASERQQIGSFEMERQMMRTELQTMKSTSEEQNNQLQELMKEKDDMHESFASKMLALEKEHNRLRNELERLNEKNDLQNEEIRASGEENYSLQLIIATKEQQMKEKDLYYNEIYAKENERLKNKLTAALKDEARLRAYLDPRAIAELYKNLYKNVWPSTFETAKKLTFAGNVKNAVKTMIKCVEMVNTFCKTEYGEMKRHFEEMLNGESTDFKEEVFDEARFIQMTASGTSELALSLLVQVFKKTLNPGFQGQKFANSCPVFVRECIRIFWMLNLHRPPIEVHTIKGGDFDRNVYEAFTEEGDTVEYVVWPALILSESVLAKGVAKCYQSSVLMQAPSHTPTDGHQETSDEEESNSSDKDEFEGNMPRYNVSNETLAGLGNSLTSGIPNNVYTEAEPNDVNEGHNGCSMLPSVETFLTKT